MIAHHPEDALLLDYAAGSLAEPVALIVATHVALCAACRQAVAALEDAGGALLAAIEPAAMEDGAVAAMLARLDEPERPAVPPPAADPLLPAPLRPYVRRGLDGLTWRRVSRAIEEARLPIVARGYKASLLRIRRGSVQPQHTHRGHVFTLVLAGGYSDGGAAFGPGDFDGRDGTHRHQPKVDDDEDCLCLVVLDAPIRLTGPVGRLANPFIRF